MTHTQATKQLIDMGCIFLSIVDLDRETILPKQQNKFTSSADIKKQADKINTFLKTAPAGTYVIQGRTAPQSKPTDMLITIGDVAPNNTTQQPAQPMADPGAQSVLSYNNALAMQNEIANLKSENNRLLLLVQSYEDDIEAMEDAQPEQMAESPTLTALGAIVPIFPAAIDMYFKAQKDRLEFEKMKFYEEMKGKQMQQQAQYQSNGHSDYDSL